MTKRTKAVNELLEQSNLIHVAGVTVADASDGPDVHMAAVMDFVDGLRAGIREARKIDMDTVTATNDVNSWERLCNSFQVAANALGAQVSRVPPKRPS